MCFLALIHRQVPDYSVVVAANRDELIARPSAPPREVRPGIWAGVDLTAGGTWLGVNTHSLVVAITNLSSRSPVDPMARSRGLLCLDLLAGRDVDEVRRALEAELSHYSYNSFNVLVADRLRAGVGTYLDRELTWKDLDPGIHIIGNSLPDRPDDPKVLRGRSLITPTTDVDALIPSLAALCRDHGVRDDRTDAICIHAPNHGTRSSTILTLHDTNPTKHRYLYAEGHPCRSEYDDLSRLLKVDGR